MIVAVALLRATPAPGGSRGESPRASADAADRPAVPTIHANRPTGSSEDADSPARPTRDASGPADVAVEVLAAQRSYPAELAGMWEFPGGKVEDGESPEAAVVREIREELGVDVCLGELIVGPDGDWPLPNGQRMRLWFATASGEPSAGSSHSSLVWLSPDALESVPWLDGDLPILPILRAALNERGASR